MLIDDLLPNMQQTTTQETYEYQNHVRSLLFTTIITQPDIVRVASKLSEHLQNPSSDYLTTVDQCISYFYSTRNFVIKYSASCNYQEVTTTVILWEIFNNSTNASFANNSDRQSREGYIFKLYGRLIDQASHKQATVMTSTTEAELLVMLHARKQAIWWENLFWKLHFNIGYKLYIKNDNQQTIHLLTTQIPILMTKLRHINISQHWL